MRQAAKSAMPAKENKEVAMFCLTLLGVLGALAALAQDELATTEEKRHGDAGFVVGGGWAGVPRPP